MLYRTLAKSLISALFLSYAGYEIYERIYLWLPWTGFTLAANLFAIPLATFWILAAFAVWPSRHIYSSALVLPALIITLTHGTLLCAVQHSFGPFFLLGSILQIFLGLTSRLWVQTKEAVILHPSLKGRYNDLTA